MGKLKITIAIDVNADVATVWEHWTDPAHIVNWNFAAHTWHCPTATNNLRVGGTFSYTMAARDGSLSFDFGGTYDSIDPHRTLTITLDDGRKVWVTFSEAGGITTVNEVFEAEHENPAEMQQAGWQAILGNFKEYVEGRQG